MTNEEKQYLIGFVKRRINAGSNCRETVKGLQKLGFKASTIRKYYKAFAPTGLLEKEVK